MEQEGTEKTEEEAARRDAETRGRARRDAETRRRGDTEAEDLRVAAWPRPLVGESMSGRPSHASPSAKIGHRMVKTADSAQSA